MFSKDIEIFNGKSFASLLNDIYKNSSEKKKQINGLIEQLRPLVTNATDASIIVPMIAEYLDVAVKNDEQLVKMAAIIQRLLATNSSGSEDSSAITEEEREILLKKAEDQMKELTDGKSEIDKKLNSVTQRLNSQLEV